MCSDGKQERKVIERMGCSREEVNGREGTVERRVTESMRWLGA